VESVIAINQQDQVQCRKRRLRENIAGWIIYFMPYISSVVGVAIVFQVLFHPSLGPINQFLINIGIELPPKWLTDIHYSLPSVMIILIWTQIDFNMIIYIAGLQNIPKDLYEAASIDGANAWQKFHNITLPLVSSTSFFLLVGFPIKLGWNPFNRKFKYILLNLQ